MTQDEARQLQRALWMLNSNELNRCSLEPGEAPGEWVVEVIWKDGRHERHPSLSLELNEVRTLEEQRAAVAEADAQWAAIEEDD